MSGLHGADPDRVDDAIEAGSPFTGDAGFAGTLPDGRIVRDVLGRYPAFVETTDPTVTAVTPDALDEPTSLAPGSVVTMDGGVQSVWSLPSPDPFPDDSAARERVGAAITTTCEGIDTTDLAIAYSGGVDSHLLASLRSAPRYTVGFPDSADLTWARKADTALDGRHVDLPISHERLEAAIPIVADATGRTNAMDVAIGVSLYLVADRAAADGYDRLLLGQGADELFGGYEKIAAPDHRTAADTPRGARREVLSSLHEGLTRDVLAVRAAGIEPVMPYLHDRVVRAALRLDGDQLVRDGRRKRILRDVAADHMPEALANRDKSAIQYGNDVATELDRLARQAGYKRRMSRHVDRYVRSLQGVAPETD